MAKKKSRQFDEAYDVDYNEDVVLHDNAFVETATQEKPQPRHEISEHEARCRDLRRRYKAVFGYKPVEKDIDTLKQLVEDAERR